MVNQVNRDLPAFPWHERMTRECARNSLRRDLVEDVREEQREGAGGWVLRFFLLNVVEAGFEARHVGPRKGLACFR